MDPYKRFLQERTILHGLAPASLRYYRWVRRAFEPILSQPTKAGMMDCIQRLLADGVTPTSVNCYLRGFKAYCRWLQAEGLLDAPFAIQFLKTEQKVIATLTDEQARRLISFKPTGRNMSRTHVVALMILDGGYRISEVLGLLAEAVDFDNLVVKVRGKGNRHRLIPLSVQMRKILYRYISKNPGRLVFGTSTGTQVSVRNFERDLSVLGQRLGISGIHPHRLRHHFACHYLRSGGNLEFLRRLLGHSSILTTQKYLGSLGVADLQVVHDRLSALSVDWRVPAC